MSINKIKNGSINSGDGTSKPERIVSLCLRAAALLLLLASAPLSAQTVAAPAQAGPLPVTYRSPVADLAVKVWGGDIVIHRGYHDGAWYPNLNWMPLGFTYDSLDNSIKTITRGRAEYGKAAPGVYRDAHANLVRQTAGGFRWNDPGGNWIEYNPAGEIKSYGNRNGAVATFLYAGGGVAGAPGAPTGEGRIAGILDRSGAQALWFDYDAGGQLARIRDASGRKVEYRATPAPGGGTLGVLDADGNTWSYAVAGQGAAIAVTDPEARTTARTWHSNGAPSGITYPDGGKTAIVQDYDAAKNIYYTRETGAGGKVTETWSGLKQDRGRGEYLRKDVNGVTAARQSLDAATRTTTHTDARGLDTAVRRDQWGNITQVVHPDGSVASSQYAPATRDLTRYADENGTVTQHAYDARGNLTQTVEALGLPEQRTTGYTVDAGGQRASMTRKGDAGTPDAVTRYEYDTSGNVTAATDPEGGITRHTWDIMGNALARTDPGGQLWARTYDNGGRLLSLTDPLNRTTRIAYDKTGLPVTLTDAAGNTGTLGYDAAGRLLSITGPHGGQTRYAYDAAGNPVRLTDAANHTRQQEYDPDGRLVKQTDGNNNATRFEYGDPASGPNGLLAKIIYPTLSRDLQYDRRDRIVGSTDSSAGAALALDASPAQTTRNTYDRAGNLTAVTGPANRTTATSYDGLGQITRTTDPEGNITRYGYDPRGNLVTATDAKGNTHRYEYDRLDRMVKEIRPLGQTTAYAYDPNGNLIQATDARGQIKRYTVDAAGRRTREDHYPDAAALAANNAAKTITYTWNTLDRLTGYADGNTSATYTYDAKQLRQTGESVNYGAFTLATGATYNALGQTASLTYPDGATYTYTYDSNNQLSAVDLPAGSGNITFNSYTWTAPAQITMPGGAARNLQYDGLLRLKDLAVKDPGQSRVMGYQYGYDLAGNITSKATEAGTTNYGYDALDRLTGAAYTAQTGTPQADESYSYDQVANRITDTRTAAAAWAYDANNQLVTADNLSYSYDANGNTTQQTDANNPANTRNYVYDTDNRLIEVRDASSTLIATYSYDPFGRRLSKDTGTSKTYYLYSAEGLIAEADAAGQITKSYGYAPGSAFTTNPLWMRTASQAGPPVYYTYQNDHLGTPMKLLNQSGAAVWGATYDAFGRAAVDPNSTVSNNLRFPGQYEDRETGLHYNWNRYYDPGAGRYITFDPIGLAGGLNGYAYVQNNPVNWIDPLGLDATNWLNTQGARASGYGPTNGNWGGGCWSGGSYSCGPMPYGNLPPTDSADACYMAHDKCYDSSCNDIKSCNKEVVQCLQKLPNNPRMWPNPPRPGTEEDSRRYRYGAMKWFK